MFRLIVAIAVGESVTLLAAPLEIKRSAVLAATLPISTTWQVEQQSGGAWSGTGVLVGGSGAAVSVRMDGFPAGATYRFQRVAGAVATLTPTLSFGWSLSGEQPGAEQPGAGQVVIESSADLSAAGWSDLALVYPDAGGRYVRALREPLGTRGFFRAEVPAVPVGDASATSHEPLPNYQGAAGFGPVYDDMPQLFKDGFIGALDPVEYHRGGANAAAAGECFELAGPYGRTTVIISDTTTAPAGTVTVGRSFFDLGPNAYQVLSGGPATGGLTAGARLVPAPVTGNLKFFVPNTSGPFYAEFRPYNHRAGVSKLEIQNSGSSTWIELPRNVTNSFVFNSGTGGVTQLLFPLQVRVTSRFGEVVSFPPILLPLVTGQRVTGSAQFEVFPDSALAPQPQHRIRPTYLDALTNVPGDQWSGSGYGGAALTQVDTAQKYAGTASMRFSSLGGFAGVTFSQYPGFPRPEIGVLKFAIRAASPMTADQLALAVVGLNPPSGAMASSALIQLPPLGTTWQVFQIPLQASAAPAVINGIQFYGRTSGALPNVWVDEVSFESR